MLGMISCILFFVVLGGISALPVFFPPLRSLARQNERFRLWLAIALALPSFLIVFGYMTFGSAVEVSNNTGFLDEEAKIALRNELTPRYFVPPPLQRICFSGDAATCTRANEFVGENVMWIPYLSQWLIALLPAVVTFIMVRYLTRDIHR